MYAAKAQLQVRSAPKRDTDNSANLVLGTNTPANTMDVNAATYPHLLLPILISISEADFVSFDLEYTGIASRQARTGKPHAGARKSLKDRYEETKNAANKYNILQVGITCARFDYSTRKYVLEPWNISISPLVDERKVGFEREMCMQTGALAFLLNHGFNFNDAFVKGVPYLSREEVERAVQIASDRIEKKNQVEDVDLKPEDVDSLDFVSRILQWGALTSP